MTNRGYVRGAPMRLAIAFRVKTGTDLEICESAFERFNVGNDVFAERYRINGNRSLSVGDVVSVSGRAYACGPLGFEPIEDFDPTGDPCPLCGDASMPGFVDDGGQRCEGSGMRRPGLLGVGQEVG
jgi:hypothetical protein